MRARAHTVFLTSWQAECMICLYQSPCFLRGIHHDAAPTLALSTAQTALGLYWYRQGWLKKMYEWRSWWLVSKFANGNLSTRVGSGRNVTYPQSQCLKKGEELADIFYSINTHAFFKFEFNFFFWQIGGHLWLSLKRTANILLRMMKITKCFHKNGQPTSGQRYTVCLLGVQL